MIRLQFCVGSKHQAPHEVLIGGVDFATVTVDNQQSVTVINGALHDVFRGVEILISCATTHRFCFDLAGKL